MNDQRNLKLLALLLGARTLLGLFTSSDQSFVFTPWCETCCHGRGIVCLWLCVCDYMLRVEVW